MSAVITEPVAGNKSPFAAWLGDWETSADPAYCRDPDGRILVMNASFARKFGCAPSEPPDVRVSDCVHSDDVALLEHSTRELARPPHQATAEHRWLTSQGIRWFAWDETAMPDASGVVIAIRAVGRDITRQRLAEEQFYRLARAVEQSPVSVVITDLDGRAQYVNSKFTAMSGHTLEDIFEKNIQVLRDGHPDPISFENLWATVRVGGEWRGELSTVRRDGGTVWEAVKVSCLRSPTGDITNFLCLREDITERKKLEAELRQAQKMESLGTLASGIAHDFNNLLAIINGYAEFCQQAPQESAALQKCLREIHSAAQRASGLVRQILTFSRKTEVRFAPVDLNQLTRELVTLMAETFPRTVTFDLKLLEQLPPLLADQNQLQQIVLNLCVNARDAMPGGGNILLSTTWHTGASLVRVGANAARGYGCLTVTDSGTGMTPEVRQRIFEPFFTTKSGSQGTGLGLAVVYGIIVTHQGFIEVDSMPGAGSSFRVYLPSADAVSPPPVPVATQEFPTGTESLLIVDDEMPLRALLTTAFARKGYHITTAASGVEAIELIRNPEKRFDAVLLDLNMPGASGVDVLKIIRICRPALRVIIVSGHLTQDARAEFERMDQRFFVQKPYKLDDLGRTLRTVIEGRAG